MKYTLPIIIIIVIFAFAQDDGGLKLGGYLESKLSYFAAENEITTANAIFRLEGNYNIGDKGKVETHLIYNYDMQPLDPFSTFKNNSIYTKIIKESLDNFYNSLDATERQIYFYIMDIFSSSTVKYLPYSSLYPKERIVIDRALIKLYFKNTDFIFGKQQIAWGSGYAYNPTDIWNIKDPTSPNTDKVGILAMNLESYFGKNSSLNIIASPGSNFDHWRYGLRLKSNAGRFDYSFSAIRDKTDDSELFGLPEKLLIGADFAGEIAFDIGWWGETAVINPRYSGMEFSDTDSLYIQVTTGFDYTFDNEIYFMAEYYYNGIGDRDSKDYDVNSLLRTSAGEMSGFAQNYLATILSYSFLDNYNVSLFSITNLDDISDVLVPELTYDFHDNILIKLNSSIFIGSSSRTEFGGMLNSVGLSVVGYF